MLAKNPNPGHRRDRRSGGTQTQQSVHDPGSKGSGVCGRLRLRNGAGGGKGGGGGRKRLCGLGSGIGWLGGRRAFFGG